MGRKIANGNQEKEKTNEEGTSQKRALRRGYLVILGTILLLGVSYAWLTLTLYGTKTNVLRAGTLSLVLDDTMGEGINIEGAVPMYDEVGLTQAPYTFTLTNDGTIESEYTIYLDDLDLEEGEERLSDSVIKYNLVRDGVVLATDFLSTIGENPNRVLDTGIIQPGETYKYELRLWLDVFAGNEAMGKVFRGRIRVEASQVIEPVPTETGCFVYTKTASAVTITDYKCYEGNPDGMPVITDVVIPSSIEGIEVRNIGNSAFESKGLTSIDIPNSVTGIGYASFKNNQITKLVIPNSVTSISHYAFSSNKIDNLKIGSGIKTIAISTFADNQLTKLNIPANVTEIGVSAFRNNQLTSLVIPDNVTTIRDAAFANNQLKSVEIPNSITTLASNTFLGNQLTNIEIPNSVTNIGNNVFANNKLTSVVIPDSVTEIGTDSFSGNQLTSLKISNNITTIPNNAFRGNQLTSVVIPEKVKVIGNHAFNGNQLEGIEIPSSVTSIGESAFWNNRIKTIVIPVNVMEIEKNAFGFNQLTSVVIQGKSSTSDFTSYPTSSPFGWASEYSDDNITWNG